MVANEGKGREDRGEWYDGSGVAEDIGLESGCWAEGMVWCGCGRARNRENVTVRMDPSADLARRGQRIAM
jgi:hypothetical protein